MHKSRCHTAYVAVSWWQTASTLGSQLRMFQRCRLGSPSQRALDGHTISNPTQWATCPTASQRNRIIAQLVSTTTRPHNRSQLVLPTNRNGGDAAARHSNNLAQKSANQTAGAKPTPCKAAAWCSINLMAGAHVLLDGTIQHSTLKRQLKQLQQLYASTCTDIWAATACGITAGIHCRFYVTAANRVC